jgi:hypothetical protein
MAFVEMLGYVGLTAAVGFAIVLMVCACVVIVRMAIDIFRGRF